MTERVYLHVGPHKTGTTYVQSLLMANRDRLAEQGVLFPRKTFGGQSRAVRELLGEKAMPTGRAVEGQWGKALDELAGWDGPAAVFSHETMSGATPSQIGAIRASLQAYDLHVVYTARDLARVAPAMWQTGLRGRQHFTWQTYAGSLRRPGPGRRGGAGRRFWYNQDAPAVLERWSKKLPVENLHVVTVPRPGNPPELLWQRFCTALGVDPAGHDLTPRRSNPSLGTAESELLRRVNEALAETDLDNAQWVHWMRWLGRRLETREDMARYTLPAEDLGWLTRRANAVIDGIRAGGYDVVGDLDDLVPQPVPADQARHPSDTSDEAVLTVAVDAVRRLVEHLAEQRADDDRDG